jgi:antitoxin component of MazEF toxin-antitoxin module
MLLSKRYKLQKSGHTYVVTIPATIIDHFNLDEYSSVKMTYDSNKLIIDLDSVTPYRGRTRAATAEATRC